MSQKVWQNYENGYSLLFGLETHLYLVSVALLVAIRAGVWDIRGIGLIVPLLVLVKLALKNKKEVRKIKRVSFHSLADRFCPGKLLKR